MGRFFKFLTPPVFTDAPKTRQANLLFGMVPLTMLAESLILVGVWVLPGLASRFILLVIGIELSGILAFLLARRGRVQFAAQIWIWTQWILAIFASYTAGYMGSPARYFYVFVVIMAGWLLGMRWGLTLSFLSIAVDGIEAYLYAAFPELLPVIHHTPASLWVMFSIFVLMGMSLVNAASRAFTASVEQVRQELSERTRAEKNARENALLLSSAIVTAHLGWLEWRTTPIRFIMDDRLRAITGIPPEQEANAYQYWYNHLKPEDQAVFAERVNELIDGKRNAWTADYALLHPKNGWVWLNTNLSVLERQPDGTALRMVGTFEDISDLKQAQIELAESEANFRALAENANDAIMIFSGSPPRLVFANQRAETLSGYSRQDLYHLATDQLFLPPHYEQLVEYYNQRLGGEAAPNQYETVLRQKNGANHPVEFSAALIHWQSQPSSIVIVRDILARQMREAGILEENFGLELIARLSTALREYNSIDQVGQYILRQVLDLLAMSAGLVIGKEESQLVIIACSPLTNTREQILAQLQRLLPQDWSAQPSLFIDSSQDGEAPTAWLEWMAAQPSALSALALVPVRLYGATSGFLILFDPQPVEIAPSRRRLVQRIAEIAASAFERMHIQATLEQRVVDRTHDLSTLYRVMTVASQALELEPMLAQVLGIAIEVVHADAGWVRLSTMKPLVVNAGTKNHAELDQLIQEISGSKPETWVIHENKPLVISARDQNHPATLDKIDWSGELIGIPLQAGGSALGVLWCFNREASTLTLENLALLVSIGERIGTTIENLRLGESLRRLAVLEERHRLARDLHDSVTQQIYGLMLFAGDAKRNNRAGNTDQVQVSLKRIEEIARQTLKELRLLIYELRPLDLLQVGLVQALRHRLDAVEKRAGIQVRFSKNGELNFPVDFEEHLYHIAIEALNNSLKHAGASQVAMNFSAAGGLFEMSIEDNGCGFHLEEATQGGSGLQNMYERASAVGAQIVIDSFPGGGTRIFVRSEVNFGIENPHLDR